VIRGASVRPLSVAFAAHAAVTALLFADVLFLGHLPYFRDVSSFYHPDQVFAASALRAGVWPLWNPTADAGAMFLVTYPGDLLLLAALGARGALRLSGPLHVWLAMCAMTALARELGWPPASAWLSGAVFGLSGCLQSLLNLLPLSHGAAWAPLVVACYLRCLRRPGGPACAALAVVAALQASTLAGEVALQTALVALVLTPALPSWRQWRALGTAGLVAALLSAPAVLGLRALLEGSVRVAGFAAGESLKWSVHPLALAEMAWPRWLGDPHTMTNLGYWGQAFFPDGYPYLVSLYLGPLVLALAVAAGRRGARLWVLAGLGVLLALGAHGPLATLLTELLPQFRTPAKFLFTATFALALLAGRGLEAAMGDRRPVATWGLAVPSALFLSLGLAMQLAPVPARRAAASVWPRLALPEAAPLAATWGPALLRTGVLAGLAAAALRVKGRLAFAPAVCVVADLLATNAGVDPAAPASFYDLDPEVAALVRSAGSTEPSRWFSYGLANSPGVAWQPAVLQRNEDVWLYYADRQTLWARTKTLDGLEGAFDEDRTGWAPPGSTLSAGESTPAAYARIHSRLRLGGVRFVLSFLPLPEDLTIVRGRARVPGLVPPLVLHEVRDALPRAFWVPDCEIAGSAAEARARVRDPSFDARKRVVLEAAPPGAACGAAPAEGTSTVRWRRASSEEVEIEAEGDAGYLVSLEGYHRHWRVESPPPGVSLLRADAGYWALPAPKGRVVYRVRFQPPWVRPAAALATLGALAALALFKRRAPKLDTSSSVALASGD
jgi:hypothetical protein